MDVLNNCHQFHADLQLPQAYGTTLDLQAKMIETKKAYRQLHQLLGDVWFFANRNIRREDVGFSPSRSTTENLRRLRALLANHSEWYKSESTVESTAALLCTAIQNNLSSAIKTIDELMLNETFMFV